MLNYFAVGLFLLLFLNKTGPSIVNGIQCVFEAQLHGATPVTNESDSKSVGAVVVKSPLCSSDHDNPTAQTFSLAPSDRITRIEVRYGDLVDSVSLFTQEGIVFRSGGTGGSSSTSVG